MKTLFQTLFKTLPLAAVIFNLMPAAQAAQAAPRSEKISIVQQVPGDAQPAPRPAPTPRPRPQPGPRTSDDEK